MNFGTFATIVFVGFVGYGIATSKPNPTPRPAEVKQTEAKAIEPKPVATPKSVEPERKTWGRMMEEMKTQPATTTVNGKCTHTFTDDEIAAIIQVMDARYPDNSKKRYREHFDDESKILEHLACVDLPFAWPEAKLPLKKAEVVAGLWTMNRSIEAIRNGK